MQNKQRLYGLVSLTRELHFQYAQYTKLSKHARYTMQKIHWQYISKVPQIQTMQPYLYNSPLNF
jgi:hypothetical protein